MTKESYFEELSYALRRRGLLTRSVEEDGLLSVEWKGSSRVRKSSAVQYDPTWVVADRAKATLAQVIEVAEIVMDYMKFLNASLSLKAEGGRLGKWLPCVGRLQRRCVAGKGDVAGGPIYHLGLGL